MWSPPDSRLLHPSLKQKHTDADTSRFVAEALVDHLRLRYRRRWKAKVRLLLVQGTDSDIEKGGAGS